MNTNSHRETTSRTLVGEGKMSSRSHYVCVASGSHSTSSFRVKDELLCHWFRSLEHELDDFIVAIGIRYWI